jgi:hypothetical protein
LKKQLEIKNKDFDALRKRLETAERMYEAAIVDIGKSREEKQELDDMLGRLRKELSETKSEGRREGRREERRERKASNVTLVVEGRPRSSVNWSFITRWTARA